MAVLEPYRAKDGTYHFLWRYVPNLPASIVFALLFLVLTILHSWRIYKLRSWFCIAFAVGCFCTHFLFCPPFSMNFYPQSPETDSCFVPGEVLGFGARAIAYNNTSSLALYAAQACLLVIAPVFFAASIYASLRHIIRCVRAEHLSIIPVKRLTWIFVTADVISLNIQASASGLTTKPATAKIGEIIVVAGLGFQLVLLACFLVTTSMFHYKLQREPSEESRSTRAPWKQKLYMIYGVIVLIFGRSIFRVVEFVQGQDGYSLSNEWTLYTLDGGPMVIAATAFWFWWPGRIRSTVGDFVMAIISNDTEVSDREPKDV